MTSQKDEQRTRKNKETHHQKICNRQIDYMDDSYGEQTVELFILYKFI